MVDTAVIEQRGEVLAQALAEVTGYEFVVTVLDDEQAVIDQMCEAPDETIGFLSAAAYVLAAEQCEVQAGSVAVNDDGLTWQSGMIVARRDSGIRELADLEGKTWAVADRDSIANFLYFAGSCLQKKASSSERLLT